MCLMYEHWVKAQRAFQPGRKLSLERNEVSCDSHVVRSFTTHRVHLGHSSLVGAEQDLP